MKKLQRNLVLLEELERDEVLDTKIESILIPDSISQIKGHHMRARITALGPEVSDSVSLGDVVIFERWKARGLSKNGKERLCTEEALIAVLNES